MAPSVTLKSLLLELHCIRGGTAGIRNLSNAQLDERQVARRTPPLIPEMHLSAQIFEASQIAENKKHSSPLGSATREKSGILPHPSCAECYILPHDLSPYSKGRSCESISLITVRSLASSKTSFGGDMFNHRVTPKAPENGTTSFFTVTQRFSILWGEKKRTE